MKRCFSIILALIALTVLVAAFDQNAQPLNLVVVLTDFGTDDYYAGALEGSIYAANPTGRISTITNEVQPFNVAEGSYILAESALWYPPGTVFMAEVNPGSGSKHRHVVLETLDGKLFVGPDNGLFTGVMDELGISRAYEITNHSLMLENKSETFQALYIYGPVAARLSAGLNPEEVGPEIRDLERLPVKQATMKGSEISGNIIHVDRYGNLITNIPEELVDKIGYTPGQSLIINLDNRTIPATFALAYGDVPAGDWLALINSAGILEIARNMESAAGTIGVSAGDEVKIRAGD
jgi:S-adenosylmethionine hydrolase